MFTLLSIIFGIIFVIAFITVIFKFLFCFAIWAFGVTYELCKVIVIIGLVIFGLRWLTGA